MIGQTFEGVFDEPQGILEVGLNSDKTLNLPVIQKRRHINYSENVLIVEAKRTRKSIYMIFQYEVIEESPESGYKLVKLLLLAMLPLRP